jgi:D-sedoheptulose 7-phosphate isomerase
VIDLSAAARRKARESADIKERFFAEHSARIATCAESLASALAAGGRLFTMGNGGSACDAQHAAVEFMHPVVEKRPAFPAVALMTDAALLTAVGNDADFSLVFARQLRLLGRPGDVVLAFSTSGQSANVNRGLQVAREIGMLSVGMAGGDGGKMPGLCDFSFVVPSFSIHRVQETQETLLHVLWDLVHVVGGHEDVL